MENTWQTVNDINILRMRVNPHVAPMTAVRYRPLLSEGATLFLNIQFQTYFNKLPSGCRAAVVTYRTA